MFSKLALVNTPSFLEIKGLDDIFFKIFASVLVFSLTLPLFPFWDSIIISTSLAFLSYSLKNNCIKWFFGILFFFTVFLTLFYIFSFDSFSAFLYGTFFHYGSFGLNYTKNISFLFLLIQIVILFSFFVLNIYTYKQKNTYILYVTTIFLYSLTTNLSSLLASSYSEQVNLNCLLIPCLYFSLYLNHQKNVQFILKCIFFSVFIVAFIVFLQHLIQDYSYFVLSTLRVRATYYYHAPASLFLALGLFFIFQYKKFEQFNLIGWISIGMILVALFLNSTRATSLSLVIAMIYMLTRYIVLKNYINCFFYLIIIVIFSGSIFYEKADTKAPVPLSLEGAPLISKTTTIDEKPKVIKVSETKNSVQEFLQKKLNNYLSDNRLRLKIAENLKPVAIAPFLGIGLGKPILAAGVGINKDVFSSHSLIFDILILTGGASFFSFILIFLVPVFYKKESSKTNEYKIHYISSALFIIFVSLFFPKEQNYLIILFFLTPLIYISTLESRYQFQEGENIGPVNKLQAVALMASIVFVFLMSPRYVLPTMEFHYANFVADKNKYDYPLFTNSLALKYGLEASFRLLKGKNIEVRMLEDDVNKIPVGNSWIFWDPLKESNYPVLLSTLGKTKTSEYGFWDTLKRPAHWQSIRLYLTGITLFKISHSIPKQGHINELDGRR